MSSETQEKIPTTEAYWDHYGIPRVTLTEALWQIDLSIEHNQTRGVWCLISEAGEGKSQGIHQLARKHNRRVVDIRTAQFSLMGAGVPQRADETGHFKIAIPADYPRPGEKCILIFDEINQGQPHAIALFFKLLEDRGIYDYTLPDDCVVIALMNPSGVGYSVTKIETNPAFNRRLMKVYVYNTFSDWKKHATSTDFHFTDGLRRACHSRIIQLLTASPTMLYTTKDRDGNKQFACPATWQTCSLSLYNLESAGVDLTSERAEARIAASINTVNAKMLCDFIRNNEVILSPDAVLFDYADTSGKVRDRVQRLKQESGGDYTGLIHEVAQYLFREKPDPKKVASSLVLFWYDMPVEHAQAFYQTLDTACKEHGGPHNTANIVFMQALSSENQHHPKWQKLNERINTIHDDQEGRANPKKKKAKDPLATL